MWNMKYSIWHERGTEKSESLTGIESMTSWTPGGRSIHWATRTRGEQGHFSIYWVHMWQMSCIQLGSALLNSSWVVISIIIQISYTGRILIFWLVDLCHVALGCDKTTFLTSLSWCNSRGVNSIHHCHYTMASADSKFDNFWLQCIQFE